MSAVELIEYALRDAEVPMSDMLARALEQIESDLATAEQDSRQKQARIERLEKIEAAAQNLLKMKGRHNTEVAYQRLVAALGELK